MAPAAVRASIAGELALSVLDWVTLPFALLHPVCCPWRLPKLRRKAWELVATEVRGPALSPAPRVVWARMVDLRVLVVRSALRGIFLDLPALLLGVATAVVAPWRAWAPSSDSCS